MKWKSWGRETVAGAAIILFAAGLAGCSAADSAGGSSKHAAPAAEAMDVVMTAQSNQAPTDTAKTEGGTNAVSAGGASGSANSPGTGIAQAEAINRKVIYKANLQMQVANFESAQESINKLIADSGSYLLSFTDSESENQKNGTFTIKVPSSGFSSFLQAIEAMPDKKLTKSINGQDVTEEFADLEARLKAREIAEARLLSFMEKATTSADLVAFSNELANVQVEIERIKGRMRFIDQNVAYSTVELHMFQRLRGSSTSMNLDDGPSVLNRASDAITTSTNMLIDIAQQIVVIAAFLLPLLPLAIVITIPFYIKRRKRKAVGASVKSQEENND